MTASDRPAQVLIVGGGIAALELLLALRVLAGPHLAITLLTAEAQFAPPAMTVAEPFERGGAQTYEWSQIADDQHARHVLDALFAVDAAERTVVTHGGFRLRYEILAIATGARRVEPFTGALTFGASVDAAPDLRGLVGDVLAREDPASVAFALPSPSSWPLPLYELALLTAQELREHGSAAAVRIVTPEEHPLGLFGPAARDAVVPTLDALGIELIARAQPREVVAGGLRLHDGKVVAADHVVTLAEVVARPVPGLPVDRAGFIPVDLHGRVAGETAVYAAGEVTSFPLRQGGLATQQADAVAEAIAAMYAPGTDPAPFAPVLRGRMLTSGAPLYLQARLSGQSVASTRALWSPPEKVAGRYLAPYLATARPPRLGAAPLAERVPSVADAPGGEHDAVTLALALAEAEARYGNTTRALQALEAARALDPDVRGATYERMHARLGRRGPGVVSLSYGPCRVSTAPPPLSVAEAMSRGGFYPGHPSVTVRETHTAWVFLAGDRAYKVKKPVRMEFLDFSTLDRRRLACLEELRVNRELAPGLGLRLRAVVALTDSYVLVDAGASGAVEYAIEMRRFDEARTMAALAERGALADEQVRAVAQRLAVFHAAAPAVAPRDPVGDVKRACNRNLRELLALADDATARRVVAAERFTGAFLVAHRREIAGRADAGRIRDGHGDLRAEHVVLEDPIMIVDRLEFDARLREIDVADDLAFLAMDLERLGARNAARLLVGSYRTAGGDPGSDALLAFYGAHRALVRAKVALLRAAQLDDPAAAGAAREQAGALLGLAERLAWRARGPLVVAVSGPPASGKSTLAAALACRSGWPVLSSDVLRKRRRGLALTDTAPDADYTLDARAAIYRELGERARAGLADGDGRVVDATFGDPRLRAAFLEGLGDKPPLCALECRAPALLRDQWARSRAPTDARGSDAPPAVVARLGASFSGWDELPDDAILALRSGVDAGLLVDQVAAWLDMRASVVFPAAARLGTDVAGAPRN